MNVREWRLQFGTVGDNDVFVPVKGLFADAAVAAVAVVIAIHIDHAHVWLQNAHVVRESLRRVTNLTEFNGYGIADLRCSVNLRYSQKRHTFFSHSSQSLVFSASNTP